MSKALAPLALAVLAMLPSAVSAQAPHPMPPLPGTRLDIVATGETRKVPDLAVISAGVVTQAADAAGAMRDNAAAMAKVVAAVRKAGVAERDIATSTIGLNPQYRYGENVPPVITGYQATNTLTIRFRDVAQSGKILDALVAAGVNQISGPTLQIDKPQAAENEARVDAIRIARSRAQLYADATGLKVKRILSISESGGYSPPSPVMYQMKAAPREAMDTTINPGEQTVGVSVTVTFELE